MADLTLVSTGPSDYARTAAGRRFGDMCACGHKWRAHRGNDDEPCVKHGCRCQSFHPIDADAVPVWVEPAAKRPASQGPGPEWFVYKRGNREVIVDMSEVNGIDYWVGLSPDVTVLVAGASLRFNGDSAIAFRDAYKRYKNVPVPEPESKEQGRSVRLTPEDDDG